MTASEVARLVPSDYRHRLIQQLSVADEKFAAWTSALADAQPDRREALAFLLVNMPADDLKNISPARIVREIDLAFQSRDATPWAKAVPSEIFLNDVLPYANTSEARDPWREDFYNRFTPLVKDCKTASEAALVLNREVFKALHVAYHATKRKKPDQSPKESVEIGYASCTGLAIILADACRAVGVPARIVGTPMWSDNSGNHTWVEIWDGHWSYVGAAEPGPLNDTWFTAQAAKADAANPLHAIYAASFRQTATLFPAIWAPSRADLFAENVTANYATPPAAKSVLKKRSDMNEALDGDWAKMRDIVPRGYVCGRANGPVSIDGRADDAAWQHAPWTEDFVDIQGGTRPAPRFRTRAKMLWDSDYFYVYAEMEEPHVWATIRDKNAVIFHDNDFEIFLDPNGDNHKYHEFEVNPLNTIWELSLPKPYRDGGKPIDPDNVKGLRSAVHIDGTLNDPSDTDRGWSVEVAIPWSGLDAYADPRACPPRDGDQWRINFSRVEWLVDVLNGGYRKIPKSMRDEDNWVWSPQGVIDMHRPERWGFVQFSNSPATASFTPDPTLPARDQLMCIYYRQQSFFKANGRFASNAEELSLSPAQSKDVTLSTDSDGFTATLAQSSSSQISVDQTSRIVESPRRSP